MGVIGSGRMVPGAASESGVTSFNTRTGVVELEASDVEALFTAEGQLLVGTGSGTGALLAKGSAGGVLTVGGAGASGLEWVVPATIAIGQQAAYNQVTSGFNTGSMSAATWTALDAGSGTSPEITLPNDGNTYRVEGQISFVSAGTAAGGLSIGLFTTAPAMLAAIEATGTASNDNPIYLCAANVTGAGQVIKFYARAVNASITASAGAAAIGTAGQGPAFIAAYRVA